MATTKRLLQTAGLAAGVLGAVAATTNQTPVGHAECPAAASGWSGSGTSCSSKARFVRAVKAAPDPGGMPSVPPQKGL